MKTIGSIIFLFGLFLIFGNLSGRFPTFPYAGTITTAIGSTVASTDD